VEGGGRQKNRAHFDRSRGLDTQAAWRLVLEARPMADRFPAHVAAAERWVGSIAS
jgi:hypothetical protein